jgi:uncharacterized protein (TIRG00374 family)
MDMQRPIEDRTGATATDPAELNLAPLSSGDRSEASRSTRAWFALGAGWIFGAAIFLGLIALVLRFGDVEIFLKRIREANPIWIAAALCCQCATYVCAAALWSSVLQKAKSPLPLPSLLRLALMELFANQAVPTGGLSGSVMVMRGLVRRGVAPAITMTALLAEVLSYYAAFFAVGVLAFVLLWHSGDLTVAWRSLLIAFIAVVAALATGLLIVLRSRGNLIPTGMLRWRPLRKLANVLDQVSLDLLRDPRLILATVAYQLAIFLLDTATLWCASRAVNLDVDVARTFTSFILASIVAALSPIPLGLGSFEGSCTGLLHLFGGGLEASLAATLILRGLTLWLPMVPGVWVIRREGAISRLSSPGSSPAATVG